MCKNNHLLSLVVQSFIKGTNTNEGNFHLLTKQAYASQQVCLYVMVKGQETCGNAVKAPLSFNVQTPLVCKVN